MATLPTALVGGSHYAIYDNYYQQIDTSNTGTIGALEAASFLKRSGLSDAILSKIWDIADANGKGYLTKSGFFTALKLVALVQSGYDISTNNLTIDVPPPNMGSSPPTPSPSPSPSSMLSNNNNKTSSAIPRVPITIPPALPVHNTSEWVMKPEEKLKYDKLFDTLQPLNGVVPGNKVKGMLMDSKLSIDTLGKIWDLADMDKDGALNRHEFCVAMHLVYKALEKYAIPSCLPPELLPPGKRKESASLPSAIPVLPVIPNGVRSVTPDIVKIASSPSAPLIPSLTSPTSTSTPLITPPSVSSPQPFYSSTPLIPVHTSTPTVPAVPYSSVNIISTTSSSSLYYSTQFSFASSFAQHVPTSSQDDYTESSVPWVITPEEKNKYDILFNQADLDKDGYVSGHEIKNVFLQSGVKQLVLAQIWSLCDTAEEGKLNSEQFALALWLISRKLKGIEPPDTLTPEMVPPSCRKAVYSLPKDNFIPISDKEIDELSKNIQKLLEDKSSLELDIENRKHDIKGKEEEVENLQGELNALLATLKQLEMQKQEAQKRLNDLQKQTIEIQNELENLSNQMEVAEKQVDKMKQQASQQEEVLKSHEEELNKKKKELEELNKEEETINKKCNQLEEEIEATLKICDNYKQQEEQVKNKIAGLEMFRNELESAISNLETVIDTNDIQVLIESNLEIEPKHKDPIYSVDTDTTDTNVTTSEKITDAIDGSSSNNVNGIDSGHFSNAFQNDPFLPRGDADTSITVKPVGTPDPFVSEELFDAKFTSKKTDFNEDPFAPAAKGNKSPFDDEENRNPAVHLVDQEKEQDPFGCDPFAILHAPPKVSSSNATTPSPRSESPSPALPPKKGKQPPPRPAPPRPAPPSLHQTGFDNDFADFSSFNKVPVVTSFSASNSPLTIKESFAKDPFRDYRYEDPFAIEDDYKKTLTTSSIGNSRSSSSLQQKSAFDSFDSSNDDPFLSSTNAGKPFNDCALSKSTPVSPLPPEEQQLAWATAESVKLEEERKKLNVQEKADLKLALKLSKSQNKKKNRFRSKILS